MSERERFQSVGSEISGPTPSGRVSRTKSGNSVKNAPKSDESWIRLLGTKASEVVHVKPPRPDPSSFENLFGEGQKETRLVESEASDAPQVFLDNMQECLGLSAASNMASDSGDAKDMEFEKPPKELSQKETLAFMLEKISYREDRSDKNTFPDRHLYCKQLEGSFENTPNDGKEGDEEPAEEIPPEIIAWRARVANGAESAGTLSTVDEWYRGGIVSVVPAKIPEATLAAWTDHVSTDMEEIPPGQETESSTRDFPWGDKERRGWTNDPRQK